MKTAEARSQAAGRTLRAGDAGLAPAGGHVVLARQGGEGLQGALHHVQVQRGHPELQRRHQSPHLRLCSRRTSLPRALPYIVEQTRKAMPCGPCIAMAGGGSLTACGEPSNAELAYTARKTYDALSCMSAAVQRSQNGCFPCKQAGMAQHLGEQPRARGRPPACRR